MTQNKFLILSIRYTLYSEGCARIALCRCPTTLYDIPTIKWNIFKIFNGLREGSKLQYGAMFPVRQCVYLLYRKFPYNVMYNSLQFYIIFYRFSFCVVYSFKCKSYIEIFQQIALYIWIFWTPKRYIWLGVRQLYDFAIFHGIFHINSFVLCARRGNSMKWFYMCFPIWWARPAESNCINVHCSIIYLHDENYR